jgi:hypothetical protein
MPSAIVDFILALNCSYNLLASKLDPDLTIHHLHGDVLRLLQVFNVENYAVLME